MLTAGVTCTFTRRNAPAGGEVNLLGGTICRLLASYLIIGILSAFCIWSIICFISCDCKFFSVFLAFCENKTYNGGMNITEFLEGTGVWKVAVEDLPEWQEFIRADDKNDEVQPLMHVCEREILKKEAGQFYACITGRTFWNWFMGQYECMECKREFNTDEELKLVWADGKGTGAEGTA